MVMFLLHFCIVFHQMFVLVIWKCLESEQPDGFLAVVEFHFDGVDEEPTVFFIPFNFYLYHLLNYSPKI